MLGSKNSSLNCIARVGKIVAKFGESEQNAGSSSILNTNNNIRPGNVKVMYASTYVNTNNNNTIMIGIVMVKFQNKNANKNILLLITNAVIKQKL